MSIPKAKINKMIQDEQDKIATSQKAKGIGITPDQEASRIKIETCRELLGIK